MCVCKSARSYARVTNFIPMRFGLKPHIATSWLHLCTECVYVYISCKNVFRV